MKRNALLNCAENHTTFFFCHESIKQVVVVNLNTAYAILVIVVYSRTELRRVNDEFFLLFLAKKSLMTAQWW